MSSIESSLDKLLPSELDTLATAPIIADTLDPSVMSFIDRDVAQAFGSAVPVVPTQAAPGAPFSTIYAFGDSLTDAGNVSTATLGIVPVSPPYVDGHFTNGPVWVQDLASDLGMPAVTPSLTGGTDFAYGGAETGETPVHTLNPTDLPSQIAQFEAQVASPQPNALYSVWIGSNDVLDIANDTALTPAQQQTALSAAVNNEVAGMGALAAHGAQNFLVLNVPDLGVTPYETARGAAIDQAASSLSAQYDSELATALQGLAASDNLKLDLIDTYSLLNQLVGNPQAYGFTNATSPLWNGNLTNPDSGTLAASGAAASQYVFFDSLHPTAQAHALLASDIAQTLTTVS